MVDYQHAATPRGLRLYVIGDVHGEAEALRRVHARIDADLARRPATDHRVIHLGDYIDRGPDSRGAVEAAIARLKHGRCYCLRGNHEQYFFDLVVDPRARGIEAWLANGAEATLASYGIEAASLDLDDAAAFRARVLEAVPGEHQQFLLGLPHLIRFGDYAFVHAGIRPGFALESQRARDLIWIRDAFLDHRGPLPAVVVHGHTPVEQVEIRSNRIGIDTGCAYGGPLTCLVLEGTAKALLGPSGPERLPETAPSQG